MPASGEESQLRRAAGRCVARFCRSSPSLRAAGFAEKGCDLEAMVLSIWDVRGSPRVQRALPSGQPGLHSSASSSEHAQRTCFSLNGLIASTVTTQPLASCRLGALTSVGVKAPRIRERRTRPVHSASRACSSSKYGSNSYCARPFFGLIPGVSSS